MSLQDTGPQGDASAPAARRRPRGFGSRARRVAWLDVTAATPLGWVLDRAPVPEPGETTLAYLVGDLPEGGLDGLTSWALEGVPAGWVPGSHYLDSTRDPVLRYSPPGGGVVELHRASGWFAKVDGYSADEARQAADLLLDAIRAAWGHDELAMLATPSSFGRDLWLRTIPHGVEYPTLPDELQQLIRATSGQGRWQSPGGGGLAVQGATVGGLTVYDMRFGYAGMLRGLGVGPWTHDERPDFAPHDRGRYRVAVTVPDGWEHLGVLGVQDDGDGWRYPCRPGERFETWADGAELYLAQRHGWSFDVRERIVGHEGRPLDLMRDRMVAVRDELAGAYRESPAVARLAAAAARTILLHTIGGLQGRGHRVTRTLPEHRVADLPTSGTDGLRLAGGSWVWTEHRASAWPETSHPEWAAAVWARCRVRVLEHRGAGALTVPYRDVLAVHSDAVYLAADPQWPDDGRVGTLRREVSHGGPFVAPRSRAELLQLRDAPEQLAVAGDGCGACGARPSIFPPDGSRWCAACHPGWPGERAAPPATGQLADAQARAMARARGGAGARNAPARVGDGPRREQPL